MLGFMLPGLELTGSALFLQWPKQKTKKVYALHVETLDGQIGFSQQQTAEVGSG